MTGFLLKILSFFVGGIKYIFVSMAKNLPDKMAEKMANKIVLNNNKKQNTYKYSKKIGFVDRVKANQKIFSDFIILSKSNADPTKTSYQKKLVKTQHPLHNAVVEEMELWKAVKAGTISPEERAPINELLSVSGTTADFSKRYLKKIGRKRLKYCKDYIEILKKYQKYPIDNYKPIRLQCLTNYIEATKKYYELLYSYLPTDKRNIIEKAFDK
ncbi:MAG: hypothetical protein IJQ50_00980 [Clostridia bacterium]|nr:hypothetical protein [Clostridia bacterium]